MKLLCDESPTYCNSNFGTKLFTCLFYLRSENMHLGLFLTQALSLNETNNNSLLFLNNTCQSAHSVVFNIFRLLQSTALVKCAKSTSFGMIHIKKCILWWKNVLLEHELPSTWRVNLRYGYLYCCGPIDFSLSIR